MKITYDWLKDHLKISAKEDKLLDKLTDIGLEVESIENLSEGLDLFKVAKIVKTEKHPNADRLKVCDVDVGNKEIKKVVDNEIKKFFKPEFLNRLDEIVIFNNLELNDIKEIAKIQLQHLEKKLNKKNLKFNITDEAINQLVENSFDHAYGARPLKRIIQKQIETKISNNILNNNYLNKDEVNINFVNGEIIVD